MMSNSKEIILDAIATTKIEALNKQKEALEKQLEHEKICCYYALVENLSLKDLDIAYRNLEKTAKDYAHAEVELWVASERYNRKKEVPAND